jgi:hypothetical protein
MINKYEVESEALKAKIIFGYKYGFICSIELLDTDDRDKAGTFDFAYKYSLFVTEAGFLNATKEKNAKVRVVNREIDFEVFWKKYNHKPSGRKEALKQWESMEVYERTEAFDFIQQYESQLKLSNNTAKLHAVRYLKYMRWKD